MQLRRLLLPSRHKKHEEEEGEAKEEKRQQQQQKGRGSHRVVQLVQTTCTVARPAATAAGL
jgi:hypothetical protein